MITTTVRRVTRAATRARRRTVTLIVLGLIALVALVSVVYTVLFRQSTYRITAQFASAPGLYDHNDVDVLGVPTGKVVSVRPGPSYVTVVLSIPSDVKIPANAGAVVMVPNPVSDRFVELTPAYTGGPTMPAGTVIPLARTAIPLEVDQVFSAVDNLSKSLGPSGANSEGALSSALHAIARLADGHGTDVHDAVQAISAALPALTSNPKALQTLLISLDKLTKTLAARNDTINSLYGDLASATSQLSSERDVLAGAITNLQAGLAQVASFIKANQANLGSSVKDLASTISALMKEQKALVTTFDTAALGFQNFNNAITPNGPCLSATGAPHNCGGLWARLTLSKDVSDFIKPYCGSGVASPMLPILLANAHLGPTRAKDTLCGAEIGLVQNQQGPPGAPATPDLDLAHYLVGAK